ncbi:MAG TPA: ABC transporter ATP-binding protein, partial [Propionibacteriaceae bacterium]|nr:ABC transporter ATP-binding protein [Propionibacteriaceae bacterium]
MTAGIACAHLVKSYGSTRVLTDVTFDLEPGHVYGLLGINGAGKTTLMATILNHTFRTSGSVTIDGEDPRENAPILARTCFVREDQKYNENFSVTQVLAVLPAFYPDWDADLAARLLDAFRLPRTTGTRKLSRGQRSALAIVISLACRAPYTFLDEPYLGLDPAARVIFYDALSRDQAAHPRTIIMSTHLIDEAADLMDEVLVLHEGTIVLRAGVGDARRAAFTVRGPASAVHALLTGREVIAERRIGRALS